MTNVKLGRWLLAVLAIVGLAVAAPAVSAHGDETAVDDAAPAGGTAAEWAAWMESQMTEHMGPESVEWMESHMGVTVDEMARDMADGDHDHGRYGQNGGMYGQNGGMYGQGHC
ncbi:hypothetical protein C5B91_17490 [Haloferax sp. Atlit-10N]|uniref:hypothetical protein n=1 Tax=Haloferax TaxID=2251 RepID=UPI0006791AC2|nr:MULTISPECIES: hypothetical protein [Haloferax]RDZ39686.1 hypothetical protein C5B86_18120 [Haloferax sp. Atlit-19N]RDZ39891.1 hypothetical protein C5B87_18475 [Haloferax sp. Atlit-16N]RDZ51182.1 hypothetical protein C5C07_16375 [Haloferax sp. Atlit-4N]RDZ56583.1 hypothetical protein C5B91_17490 [Haloferax sp. Atlit-10N]REA02777.1 hypothetical protein DEQ92_13425 [Haloferax sp. Atlit-6N]